MARRHLPKVHPSNPHMTRTEWWQLQQADYVEDCIWIRNLVEH